MKLVIVIGFVMGFVFIYSCKEEDHIVPDPVIEIKIGHLVSDYRGTTTEDLENQDTLFLNAIDAHLAIKVTEKNLAGLSSEIDNLNFEDLKSFEISIQSNNDFEWYPNKYVFGFAAGQNARSQLDVIQPTFLFPIQIGDPVINDKVLQLTSPDILRISYESNYTGLSKVKTFIIK